MFPKTVLGKWSLGLSIAFFSLFLLFQRLVASGQRGGETFSDNLMLSIPISLAGLCGIASFFVGIIGIIKQKERNILVFASTLLGLFILVFVLGEILVPH
ncbi:MAG: hypothetical protein Q7S70_01280 [bacterium]|nr:hypothetical protein [bacterium]